MTDYAYILIHSYPHKVWTQTGSGYEDIEWLDSNPVPSKQELDTAYANYIAANGYKDKRASAYPQATDQLDMLWHAIDSGTDLKLSEFYTARKAVKDEFPKPSA